MKTKDLAAMPKKERADRTYQRIVYRKLVDLQTAIWDARRRETPLGLIDELDTQNLIEDLVEIADIEYRSPAEKEGYEAPARQAEIPPDLPIITLENDDEIDY